MFQLGEVRPLNLLCLTHQGVRGLDLLYKNLDFVGSAAYGAAALAVEEPQKPPFLFQFGPNKIRRKTLWLRFFLWQQMRMFHKVN